jgi:hypothetical protein
MYHTCEGERSKVLDRKAERSRALGRHMCRWKDTTKRDFKEIIWDGLDYVCLPQDTEPSWGMRDHSKEPLDTITL